jgi:cytochrome P450
LITDTKIIQEILVNQAYDFRKPDFADLKKILGEGIGFAEGETHKKQRKMMNIAFSHNNIKVLYTVYLNIIYE